MRVIREQDQMDEKKVIELRQLNTEYLRQFYYPNEKAVGTKKMMEAQAVNLVAELDGQVVGYCSYYVQGERLKIMGMGVDPKFQNRGVGRNILYYLTQIARDHDLETLSLYTVKQTGNVEKFKNWGFEVMSEETSSLFESANEEMIIEICMEKMIRRTTR